MSQWSFPRVKLRLSTSLGFLQGASLKDDQFNLLVWLLRSLLCFHSL